MLIFIAISLIYIYVFCDNIILFVLMYSSDYNIKSFMATNIHLWIVFAYMLRIIYIIFKTKWSRETISYKNDIYSLEFSRKLVFFSTWLIFFKISCFNLLFITVICNWFLIHWVRIVMVGTIKSMATFPVDNFDVRAWGLL